MTVTLDPDSDLIDTQSSPSPLARRLSLQTEEVSADDKEMARQLIDALSSATHEKLDFSRNETMRKIIDHLFDKNPRAFGNDKSWVWKTQEARNLLITALTEQFNIETSSDGLVEPQPDQISQAKEENAIASSPVQDSLIDLITKDYTETKRKYKENNTKNLGLAFLWMQEHVHEVSEARIHKLIDQLKHLNEINKDLSDLINVLSACKESGKADFSQDTDIQALIDRIYEVNPKIFGTEKTYVWNSEKQIDVVLSALDAEVKTRVADVNQTTMFINVRFDERIQFAESARKVLEMLIRHVESIISKYHKT